LETEFGGLFLEVGEAAGWSGQGLFEEEQRNWQSSTKSLSSRNVMNTLIDIPTSARLQNNDIMVGLESGLEFSFPCAAHPRLAAATNEQRSNIELSPMGIHWPDIDEDLSISGLVRDRRSASETPLLTPDPPRGQPAMNVPPSFPSPSRTPGQAWSLGVLTRLVKTNRLSRILLSDTL
jgi:hypothetical protein